MTNFSDDLYAKVETIDNPSGDLSDYIDSLGAMFAEVEYLGREGDDGVLPWGRILDPDLATTEAMLRWLAQLAGVKVPVGLDATNMRTLIKAAESRRRGTIVYMVEVAQRLLTGTKTVYTHERVSSAYTLSIATKATETPDSAAVLKALLDVKPAGIVLTYASVTGVIWDTPTHAWDAATTVTWDASLSTVP